MHLYSASLAVDQNNEAGLSFFFSLKIHTFESLFRSHVSSELGTVNIIEIQGYSNLGQGLNNDNAIGVSCMCTPKFKRSMIDSHIPNSVKSLSIQNLQALFFCFI